MTMEPSSSYKDGEVVWVKWGAMWWPGEVHNKERVPEDMMLSLRKPVIAFVKFLQEDSFELVRSNNNISKYVCDKKIEHIKKGIDKYRSNSAMMDNFVASITKAEQMTGGNVNILKTFETPTKAKSFPNTTTVTPEAGVMSTSPSNLSPATSSAKKSLSSVGSYNASVKVQNTSNADRPNDKRIFTCTMCPFTTDRLNLLMMHIKGHSLEIQSRVNASPSMIEIRRPVITKTSRKHEVDDGIAEDVRKIKESMKEQEKAAAQPIATTSAKKPRTSALNTNTKIVGENATPKTVKSRASKRSLKAVKETSVKVDDDVEEEKSKVNEELKKELLADWLDEDDFMQDKNESSKIPVMEKNSPVSVPIRNIPKKQRVSEVYIQPEIIAAVEPAVTSVESSQKSQANLRASSKRKQNIIPKAISPSLKKQSEEKKVKDRQYNDNDNDDDDDDEDNDDDDDEKLLLATADLLNETEVPKSVENDKVSDAQTSSTTFHKSNDIDKRNLPPKERNKRIFRARNRSSEAQTVAMTSSLEVPVAPAKLPLDEQTAIELVKVVAVSKNDRQEMMLPHKKKQSSRLPLTTSVTSSEIPKNQPITAEVTGGRNNKKKRKSSSDVNEELQAAPKIESPLRESTIDPIVSSTTTTTLISQYRGQKRPLSYEHSTNDPQQQESKRFHKSHDLLEPRTITCNASEAICITSKGTLTVARRDSLKTTQANSVVVTSQVIISEPIVSTLSLSTPSCSTSKMTVVSLPQQTLKNALKIPKENMEELKKQGLLTIENNRTKLTPKGLQIFKEYQRDEKMATSSSSSSSTTSSSTNSLNVTSSTTSISSTVSSTSISDNSLVNELKLDGGDEIKSSHGEVDEITSKNDVVEEDEDVEMKEVEKITQEKNVNSSISDNLNEDSTKDEEIDSPKIEKDPVCEEPIVEEKLLNELELVEQKNGSDQNGTDSIIEEEENHSVKSENSPIIEPESIIPDSSELKKDTVILEENESSRNEDGPKIDENDLEVTNLNDSQLEEDSQQEQSAEISSLLEEPLKNDILEETEEVEEEKESTKVEENSEKKSEHGEEEEEEEEEENPIEDGEQQPKENGSKELKDEEGDTSNCEDANTSSGAGLIALQAETFGGPPNCFYLCRQVEDRYEPVDNQILVLNAQNALVPYEDEILSEVSIPSGIENQSVAGNISAYSQLSPSSNIVINTPNGQKVELNYFAIVTLQESADENGIASVELGGEQIELNINGILEAIAAQQETEGADLLPSAMLIDGAENSAATGALILTETTDLPFDINHSATQVSETLTKPIMSTTIAPEIVNPNCPVKSTIAEKNLNIEDSLASIGVTLQTTRANIPKSLELPITVTNPTIAETANHRKLAAAATMMNPGELVSESLVLQATDNGSDD